MKVKVTVIKEQCPKCGYQSKPYSKTQTRKILMCPKCKYHYDKNEKPHKKK